VEPPALSPLELYALLHLRLAGLDYAFSLARTAGVRLEEAGEALERLEAMGLVERAGASAVKNTEAKMKLSSEVRKHHTYYKLTRRGEMLLRGLRRGRGLAGYVDELCGAGASRLLAVLVEKGRRLGPGEVAAAAGLERGRAEEAAECLAGHGLVSERRGGYSATRLAELLARRLGL
jgi:predicted transcriptional regulator